MIWVEVPTATVQDWQERVSVALGTRVACPDDMPGDFEPGARVVSEEFSSLDMEAVFSNDDLPARQWNTVAVVAIRAEVVNEIRGIKERFTRRDKEYKTSLASAVTSLVKSLPDDAGWCATGQTEGGFSLEPRPRNHTTVNQGTGMRVGLHLDSWDQLAPRERWKGSNRICLNLGTSPRGFLFVPESASTFADRLAETGIDIDHDNSALRDAFGISNLARRFLEVFPNQVIIRVLVWPGEAYIAPTENLIHDGYAPPGPDPDLTLTVRGNWGPTETEISLDRLYPICAERVARKK